ncbi:hypothetical protein ABW19_dt0206805 [Dactylella cylindrospora]|nr:hypothetical protein ABW19_dt0206805 [Dactylella cylindrospora]
MLLTRSLLFLSLSSLLSFASAQSNPFTSPSSGDTVTAGETFEITWTPDSSYDSIGLSICRGSGQDCSSLGGGIPNDGSYDWTPSTSLEPDDSYYLIMTGPTGSFVANSNTFEVEGGSSSPSSTSSAASSGSSSTSGPSSTSGSESSTSSGSPSSTSTSTPNTDSGSSSNGAIIGGAIGAVVVVIAIAVAGFIWMRKRNQKKLAEARSGINKGSDDDDVEAGKKYLGVGPLAAGKKSTDKGADAYAPKEGFSETDSIPLAELPAIQQEPVEMASAPTHSSGQQFFVMELDSREIPRPGTSTVQPDPDGVAKPSMDKDHNRGVSIDGTTVNSETERPKTAGTIEQIKEETREASSSTQPQTEARSQTPAPAPVQTQPQTRASTETSGTGSRARDSTPQIRNSFPRLPAFDFDSSKF